MVQRKAAVCAAAAGLLVLLMTSCGGGGGADTGGACGGASACVTTVAGTGQQGNVDGSMGDAQFSMPHSVVVDAQSNIHVADYGSSHLTRLISQGRVSSLSEDPIAFPFPADVATDAGGNSYVADTYANRILKVTPSGETTIVAGTGQSGDSDGNAATATFSMPTGLAFDAGGALYVADMGNRKIRKIEFSYR